MSFFVFCNSDTMIQRCIAGNLNYFDSGKLALFSAQSGKSDELMSSGLHDGDVLAGDSNGLKKIFSVSDDETFIYVTNKCNSNCIMCPSSQWERRNGSHMSVDEIIESIRYYPDSINYVTITGGEPLLLKEDLFRILDFLKNKKPQAGYLLLTNGRGFAINKYAQLLRNSAPKNTLVGVPLHSADAQKHDYISGCHQSFDQTMSGLRNLLNNYCHVEIRIVINRLNYEEIPQLMRLISRLRPKIEVVTFILMEMSGNAAVNRNDLWIPIRECFLYIERGLCYLLDNEIDFRFYNFPLCVLPVQYWATARKSISKEKICYLDKCDACTMKNECGGFFKSSRRYLESEIKAYV